MNRITLGAIMTILVLPGFLHAALGKITLTSGKTISGDIRALDDGGCWVTTKSGSIKFDRDEIRKIRILSRRDPVQEKFASAYRVTPRGASRGRTTNTPYDTIIHQEAAKNDLDPALVKAVIKAESNFNNRDVSSKGACGLMQLMPGTARILGVERVFNPAENIRGGTRYLRDMLALFGGDVEKALAAYNAGPAAVRRYRSIPPYRETREYVRNVSRYYRLYRRPGEIQSFTDESGKLTLYNVR